MGLLGLMMSIMLRTSWSSGGVGVSLVGTVVSSCVKPVGQVWSVDSNRPQDAIQVPILLGYLVGSFGRRVELMSF